MKHYYKLILSGALLLSATASISQAQTWDCPSRPARYQISEITAPLNSEGESADYLNQLAINGSGQVLIEASYPNGTNSFVIWKQGVPPVVVDTVTAEEGHESLGISDAGDVLFYKQTLVKGELEEKLLIFSPTHGVRTVPQVYPKLDITDAFFRKLATDGLIYFDALASKSGEINFYTQSVNKAGNSGGVLPLYLNEDLISYDVFGVGNRAVGFVFDANFNYKAVQYIPSTNQTVLVPGLTAGSTMNYVSGVNDRDYVVGTANLTSGNSRAVLWKNGTAIRNIGILSGDTESFAVSHNANNEVIGISYGSDDVFTPFIWTRCSGLQALDNKRPTSFTQKISDVLDINNLGQLVVVDELGRFLFMRP